MCYAEIMMHSDWFKIVIVTWTIQSECFIGSAPGEQLRILSGGLQSLFTSFQEGDSLSKLFKLKAKEMITSNVDFSSLFNIFVPFKDVSSNSQVNRSPPHDSKASVY